MGSWDLSILYTGFDSPEYKSDFASLCDKRDELIALAGKVGSLPEKELIKSYIALSEEFSELISKLAIFANLSFSANTKDTEASSALGRVLGVAGDIAGADTAIKNAIAKAENISDIIRLDSSLAEYEYFIMNIVRDSKYLLSEGEEKVFAKLNISGAGAWSDLQSSLTSSVKVEVDGEKIGLAAARNLAYSPDGALRKRAYEAELKAYEGIKDPVAFALNSIKLQVISECEMRGFESALDKALYNSRMKKATLNALMTAIEERLPVFRKYLKAKARALGKSSLPWYDLFAPIGKSNKVYTRDEAKDYLLSVFSSFDPELHDMVKEAFENRWIDFYPRDGKVGGAFDCGVPSAKQSRVLTNFDGSFSDIVTLAHELGHAFHDRQVFSHSIINQDYSMPVAETASTFNEVMVMTHAIENASSKDERLALIESELMDATQIICDIYSRYTFESEVFANRKNEFMSAEKFCEMMLSAQKKAYGDGLDEGALHPYMWLCKGHYYSGGLSFYNFPYAFGGLFARGLYAIYRSEGKNFADRYKKLLNATSVSDVEDAAKVVGVDLTCPDFWRRGLDMIEEKINLFSELIG